MLDKEMTLCQSRDGAEIFLKVAAAQWCNPEDGTAIPRYLRRTESGTIIALCRYVWSVRRRDSNKSPKNDVADMV